MTILTELYTLIISPLELLFEVIFTIANRLIGNAGLSIVFLSLAVNILVLPLYKRADELQAEERDIQAKMAPWIKHIKKTFKGDERFFMLQEYYRINHYKPIYALKSTFSILLQIPFFIAAYNLLSGMQSIKGLQFGIIADLGKEDALFTIGSFPVNVLPILMTLINIVSGIIYTKDHPLKEKIQVYGLAVVFLVLLYRSPAGLVFYWLLNNVFSLVKNVFHKLKNPKKALHAILTATGAALIIATLLRSDLNARQKILLCICGIMLVLPLISGFIKRKKEPENEKCNTAAFFTGTVMMALLTGLVIPSSVINASVTEFVDVFQISHPFIYIINSLLLSLGIWVFWGGVFFIFIDEKSKNKFSKTIWIICGVSVVDYMFFGTNLGNLSSTLQYDANLSFSLKDHICNVIIVIVVCCIFDLLYSKVTIIVKYVLFTGILAVFSVGIINSFGVFGGYNGFWGHTKPTIDKPSISLNKNGKNVIVIMLDRAMGTQVPYIFNEKPELKEKFDGFTYYPNTISYGTGTMVGSPAIFGGYEYTPESMNERNSEILENKHNEALKVMPVLFSKNGYSVTIIDPPLAGYEMVPDLSIFDNYPDFRCYITSGALNYFNWDENSNSSNGILARTNTIRNRNFIMFSLMKISPVILQETIYDDGLYNESINNADRSSAVISIVQTYDGLTKSKGNNLLFLNSYSVLYNLSNITAIQENNENTFSMVGNDTTHSPCMLQEPDYVPQATVDNTRYDTNMVSRYTIDGVTMKMEKLDQVRHYHVNMAAYQMLAKWFDYLREQGVYDNTRIILVSDHGKNLSQFDYKCGEQDIEAFMPLLMVKDFNAKGFTINYDFMTNGDTPAIAMKNIIDNPQNPFTNKPIDSNAKKGAQNVIVSKIKDSSDYENRTTFITSKWYSFNGNDPHVMSNWKYIGEK